MKLFKILFSTILSIVILVMVIVIALVFTISGEGNVIDKSVYSDLTTTEELISSMLSKSLNEMDKTYSISLTFDEKKLNNLSYNLIRNFNPNYDPLSDGENANVLTGKIPDNMPLLGGKKLIVENISIFVKDNILSIDSNIDILGFINSRLFIELGLETTENEFALNINTLKIGKLNVLSDNLNWLYNNFISNVNISNTPFVIDKDNKRIVSEKSEFASFLKEQLKSDDNLATKEFIELLTNPEYNMVNFNIVNSTVDLKLNLDSLKVDDSLLVLDDKVTTLFDTQLFIENKTQSIALNALSSNDKKIVFTFDEFNKMLYTQTDKYKDLNFSAKILDSANVSFSIEGIVLSSIDDKLNLKLILNINGMKTIANTLFEINNVNDSLVTLKLSDTIVLGNNVTVNSSFIKPILVQTLNRTNLLKYNETNDVLEITSEIFNSFISSANAQTILTCDKISLNASGLSVYVKFTDSELEDKLSKVSATLENVLKSNFLDESKLDLETPEQREAVDVLISTLESARDILNDPESVITTENTENLINAISNLSQNNQEELINQIESCFNEEDLQNLNDLYNELFK